MYDRILLPTDGSAGTARVADHAIDLANRYGARLDVLSVIDVGGDADGAAEPAGSTPDTAERATAPAVRRAEEAGVEARAVVAEGAPSRVILEHADTNDVDLIVMGTHGRSGLDRVLLGSVTERVVRLAPIPVLTVGLSDGDRRVPDATTARELAAEALRRAGHEITTVDDVYEGIGTWVVVTETTDGHRRNVHIDAATRETRVATLNGD